MYVVIHDEDVAMVITTPINELVFVLISDKGTDKSPGLEKPEEDLEQAFLFFSC